MAARAMNMRPGTASWMRILCKALLMGPLSRQSVERLPLVTVAKAKAATENTQCIVLGVGMLIPPSSVMYCSHKLSACRRGAPGVRLTVDCWHGHTQSQRSLCPTTSRSRRQEGSGMHSEIGACIAHRDEQLSDGAGAPTLASRHDAVPAPEYSRYSCLVC